MNRRQLFSSLAGMSGAAVAPAVAAAPTITMKVALDRDPVECVHGDNLFEDLEACGVYLRSSFECANPFQVLLNGVATEHVQAFKVGTNGYVQVAGYPWESPPSRILHGNVGIRLTGPDVAARERAFDTLAERHGFAPYFHARER